MALVVTKRNIERQALQAIHHPPKPNDTVKVSKEMQDEKRKMVRELVPFLTMLYRKYMDAKIQERVVESYLNNQTTKHLTKLNEIKKKSLVEDINIPINVGDTVLGGKFKNKRIVVKSIGKNEKGEITINDKPLLKYRLVDEGKKNPKYQEMDPTLAAPQGYESPIDVQDELEEANAVSGGKIHKFITGNNLTLQGKKHSQIEFEVLSTDNKSQLVKLRVLFPKNLAGQELNVPFKTIRRGPFIKTNTKGQFEGTINEIPMADLKQIDQFADKQLNPVDVVLTDKHFFDRLNDPRNGKEISNAELIGFFKRLAKHKKEFVEFLEKYKEVVATDDRTNINIPFMKQSNKAIAKTIMRKNDFKTSGEKLEF